MVGQNRTKVGLKRSIARVRSWTTLPAKSNQGGIETDAAVAALREFCGAKSNQGGIETDNRTQVIPNRVGQNRTKVGLKPGSRFALARQRT